MGKDGMRAGEGMSCRLAREASCCPTGEANALAYYGENECTDIEDQHFSHRLI